MTDFKITQGVSSWKDDGSEVKNTDWSFRGPGSIPSTHTVALNNFNSSSRYLTTSSEPPRAQHRHGTETDV